MEVKGPTDLRIEAETDCPLADVADPSVADQELSFPQRRDSA